MSWSGVLGKGDLSVLNIQVQYLKAAGMVARSTRIEKRTSQINSHYSSTDEKVPIKAHSTIHSKYFQLYTLITSHAKIHHPKNSENISLIPLCSVNKSIWTFPCCSLLYRKPPIYPGKINKTAGRANPLCHVFKKGIREEKKT